MMRVKLKSCQTNGFVLLTTALFVLAQLQQAHSQSTSSSYGKEFYTGFMSNVGGTFFTSLRLTIGTNSSTADYVVESTNGIIKEGTISFGSPVTIEISSDFQVTSSGFDNRAKGIHVYTTNDATIFLIAENFVFPFNHGVFLAYPCLTFETGYEYYVISADATGNLNSQILLVGCEDETIITVTPTQLISLPENLQEESSALVSIEAGVSGSEMSINQMQTLLITSTSDLTLTKIVSNKPLTVIAGHECASVPFFSSGCEPLAFQVPPSITWGTNFLLVPFAGRETDSIFKIITTNESSVSIACVNADYPLSFRLQGKYEFATSQYCYLRSSQPLLVVELALSGTIDGKGDPAIAQVSPLDQYVNEISFLTLPSNAFSVNYVSVAVPIEHFNPTSILFNGEVLSCHWNAIFNDTETMQPIGYGCNTTVPSATTSSQQHTVSHSDINGLISVLVYGFNSRSSTGYAYLAGQQILVGDGGGEEVIIEERDVLPMFDITDFPGVLELERVEDATSDAIYIPDGFIFGDEVVTTAFVNENGAISFQVPYKYSLPNRYPTNFYWTQQSRVVAPFWADNDIRKEGAVRYASYCNITGKPDCQLHEEGQAILDEVNTYIQGTQADGDDMFIGNWMLIAFWDHVHPSPHGDVNTRGIPEEILSKTNTYQAVIISNVAQTFAVFTFLCGGVEWSAVGSGRAAVQGYNEAGNHFFNHRLSGYLAIGDSVSCIVGQGKRRKRETDNAEPICFPANPELQGLITICRNFKFFQVMIVFAAIEMEASLNAIANSLPPCPPTRMQANLDRATFRLQPNLPECYVSVRPVFPPDIFLFQQFGVTQQCCYNDDSALVTEPGGNDYAGTMLFQDPLQEEPDVYNSPTGDKNFRDSCCDPRLNNAYCSNFFDARRPTDAPIYKAPGVGIGCGDPHYQPFDWNRYHHFQGTGDFTIMEVINEDERVFTLQGRLARFYGSTTVAWHAGIACGGSDIAFELVPPFGVIQTKPGPRPIVITGLLEVGEAWQPPVESIPRYTVELTRTSATTLVVDFFTSRVSLVVNFRRSTIDYEVHASSSGSEIIGLLGNLDGDGSNEFVRRDNGEQIPYAYPVNIYLELDFNSWSITDSEDSLFSNPARRKRQTDPEPEPFNFDDLTFTDEQRELCKDSPQCLVDLHASGDMNIALLTLRTEEEANKTIETLTNFPPNITASLTFRVTINRESVLHLSVTDPGDNVTLFIQGGLPDNSVLDGSEGEYTFRWTLQQATYQAIVFLANDSKGAASLFSPRVEVCACVNGGNCTLDGVLSDNSTVVLNCLCTEAFDGRFCEEDRNGCSEIQCFEGVECMDVPAPGVGAVCEACPPGLTGDSQKCYDIDECLMNNICEQICNNTEGGFFCTCKPGYQPTNTSHCEDVDECASINDCQQLCINTIGTYNCNCKDGFTLEGDGRNCTANEPCDGACSFGCAVIDGEEQCFCQAGFELSIPGGTECVDRDECAIENSCQQMCSNTEGSFKCSCVAGYQLLNDGQSCEDIDECFVAALEATPICESDPNTQCMNSDGSFVCVCVQGFLLNKNGTCERIINEPPPPPPPVIRPASSEDNSVNYTAPVLTPESFTPERRQRFRQLVADAVTRYCSEFVCELIVNKDEKLLLSDLKIDATNVALPSSLVFEDDEGQLVFTLYVQVGDGFLSKQQLQPVLMRAESQLRDAGFLAPLPTTPPTTQSPTTTQLPTTEEPTTEEPTTEEPTTEEPTTEEPTTEEPTTAEPTTEEPTTEEPTTEEPTTEEPTTEEPTTEDPTTAEPTTEEPTTEEPTTEEPTTEEPTTEDPTTAEPTTEEPTTEEPTTEEPTTEEPTTVEPTTEEPTPKVNCDMDADAGPCFALIPRYFFNTNTGKCEIFTYGGCDGNGNNYRSLQECTQQCNPNSCPPYCTVEYCSAKSTRTALCTLREYDGVRCDAKCRVTYCHTCYYDDEYRPLPRSCKTCSRVEIEFEARCFRRWAVCTRRADVQAYPKVRPRERTSEKFKCYGHPCA